MNLTAEIGVSAAGLTNTNTGMIAATERTSSVIGASAGRSISLVTVRHAKTETPAGDDVTSISGITTLATYVENEAVEIKRRGCPSKLQSPRSRLCGGENEGRT